MTMSFVSSIARIIHAEDGGRDGSTEGTVGPCAHAASRPKRNARRSERTLSLGTKRDLSLERAVDDFHDACRILRQTSAERQVVGRVVRAEDRVRRFGVLDHHAK